MKYTFGKGVQGMKGNIVASEWQGKVPARVAVVKDKVGKFVFGHQVKWYWEESFQALMNDVAVEIDYLGSWSCGPSERLRFDGHYG